MCQVMQKEKVPWSRDAKGKVTVSSGPAGEITVSSDVLR